ncbi:MAG: PepSY domain-containing protein [Bacteroidales bacterium]|nr:PepSY domain-containing protein [Bacteroidales bacterium]
MKFLRKYHKWLSIVFSLFILAFALSGIVLNHRETFSGIDLKRGWMAEDYQYKNWNNAAINGTKKIGNDSILVYGNIGVWLTDSNFSAYTDFNHGFPKGVDNRKIADILHTTDGKLFAATLFGLYNYDKNEKAWKKISLPVKEKRVVDLLEKDGKIYVLTRSHLFTTMDGQTFKEIILPEPESYDHKIGLFKTLWVIHSGEIYGSVGKLIVDMVAIIFIFLTITGIILFINGYRIKSHKKKSMDIQQIKKTNRWNLKWHNKIGWTTVVLLIITTSTGMFLRPPLLAFIGNAKVGKIPFTELDTPNPWFDLLRRIEYDSDSKIFILSTMDAFYYSEDNFLSPLKRFRFQPPASVMGVTVLEKKAANTYLVGSFEGLFLWDYSNGFVFDYIKKQPWQPPVSQGAPIGDFKISGYTEDFGAEEIIFDYSLGAINLESGKFPAPMSEEIIDKSGMSLWNFSLEVHTARIYVPIFGIFYILIIPISGLIILFILISGTIVWYKKHRKKAKYKD